jgi:hypothetical protein
MWGMGFFCCCILPAVFACFLVVWLFIGERFHGKSRWLFIAAAVPAFAALMLIAGLVLQYIVSRPNFVFKSSFGFEPPPDVQIVNSSCGGFADCCVRHLRFYADPSTIDKITSQGLWGQSDSESYSHNDPQWWRPSFRLTTKVYKFDAHGRCKHGYSSEHEILVYDPSSKEAYYRYIGID